MTTTAPRRPGSAGHTRETFADVVLLASVVLFVLLATGVGLLALQRSLH
jgi:hypothetical protein